MGQLQEVLENSDALVNRSSTSFSNRRAAFASRAIVYGPPAPETFIAQGSSDTPTFVLSDALTTGRLIRDAGKFTDARRYDAPPCGPAQSTCDEIWYTSPIGSENSPSQIVDRAFLVLQILQSTAQSVVDCPPPLAQGWDCLDDWALGILLPMVEQLRNTDWVAEVQSLVEWLLDQDQGALQAALSLAQIVADIVTYWLSYAPTVVAEVLGTDWVGWLEDQLTWIQPLPENTVNLVKAVVSIACHLFSQPEDPLGCAAGFAGLAARVATEAANPYIQWAISQIPGDAGQTVTAAAATVLGLVMGIAGPYAAAIQGQVEEALRQIEDPPPVPGVPPVPPRPPDPCAIPGVCDPSPTDSPPDPCSLPSMILCSGPETELPVTLPLPSVPQPYIQNSANSAIVGPGPRGTEAAPPVHQYMGNNTCRYTTTTWAHGHEQADGIYAVDSAQGAYVSSRAVSPFWPSNRKSYAYAMAGVHMTLFNWPQPSSVEVMLKYNVDGILEVDTDTTSLGTGPSAFSTARASYQLTANFWTGIESRHRLPVVRETLWSDGGIGPVVGTKEVHVHDTRLSMAVETPLDQAYTVFIESRVDTVSTGDWGVSGNAFADFFRFGHAWTDYQDWKFNLPAGWTIYRC